MLCFLILLLTNVTIFQVVPLCVIPYMYTSDLEAPGRSIWNQDIFNIQKLKLLDMKTQKTYLFHKLQIKY